MLQKLKDAFPGAQTAIFGSLLWAMTMVASAAVSLWLDDRALAPNLPAIAILFALGGFTAFVPADLVARSIEFPRRETRFAAAFLAFTFMTVGMTALTNAVYFLFQITHWHGDLFTADWVFQVGFTIGAAIYHFAVFGLRLFFPVGFVALFVVSIWHANQSR